jgi:hypothetical protein
VIDETCEVSRSISAEERRGLGADRSGAVEEAASTSTTPRLLRRSMVVDECCCRSEVWNHEVMGLEYRYIGHEGAVGCPKADCEIRPIYIRTAPNEK